MARIPISWIGHYHFHKSTDIIIELKYLRILWRYPFQEEQQNAQEKIEDFNN